nr:pentapeptide repeat-containing protein [Nocardia bovistercoris]
MGALADDWHSRDRQDEVQVCIDVLCGYLRLPYLREHGDSHLTKRVISRPRNNLDRNSARGAVEDHFEYRQNDREVRQTIVKVIASRLKKDEEHPWSICDFDFSDAVFENANFSEVLFEGNANFDGAEFYSDKWTVFMGSIFEGDASFDGAKFHEKETLFMWTLFKEAANFNNAEFYGDLTAFDGAAFAGGALFRKAKFYSTDTFFTGMVFAGAMFNEATFMSERVKFDDPKIWRGVDFDWNDDASKKPSNILPSDWPPKELGLGTDNSPEKS